MVYVQGTARIRHADTAEIYEIDANQIDFEAVASDERSMGLETTYSAIVHHPQLGQLLWSLWEYPVGAENYQETDVGPHELLQNVEFGLQHEPPDDEDRQEAIDALVEWFFEHFQDPANRLPYESAEGGYQWIDGGPYDAREQLGDNFPHEAKDVIEAAVDKIESDGLTEWAAISSPEDHDDHDDEDSLGEGDLNQIVLELDDLISGIPEPQTYPVFRFGDDGIVHMAPAPDRRSYVGDDDLLEELRRASADLQQSLAGTNAHTDLCRVIEDYEAALLEDPISISRLYGRGVRLENASRSVRSRIEVEDLPPFSSETEQDLDSVLVLHATYIMSDEDGRRLANGAAAYRRTPVDTVNLRDAAERISSAASQRLDLFSEEVRQHVAEVAHDVGEGPHPDRSNQMAVSSIGNMMVSLLKKIGGVGAGAILGGAVAISAPGVAAIAAGAGVIDAVISFLTLNVSLLLMFAAAAGSALFWLPPILRLLKKLPRGGKK